MFEQIPIGTLFSSVLSELRGQAERTRAAARSLCEAAWDYQRAVWLFASVHQYGVARAARDIAEVESQAVEKIDAATREFTKDYDWPEDLRKIFTKEIQQINLETANVKVFSMTGQYDDMKRSARQIENACERIRAAARPHTLGFWRRVSELRTVMPAEVSPKRWWEVWWGQSIILVVTGVTAGLIIWAVTSHYDKPKPSTTVEQLTAQPQPQATQPEAKPQENSAPKSAHDGTTKKVKIEQHRRGGGAVGGIVPPGTTITATTNAPDSAAVGINTGTVNVNPPVNQNQMVITYPCDGTFVEKGPTAPAAMGIYVCKECQTQKDFIAMMDLYNRKQWQELLNKCTDEVTSAPEWLTPRLLCSAANFELGNNKEAGEMLKLYDTKKGSAYEVYPCQNIDSDLHKALD